MYCFYNLHAKKLYIFGDPLTLLHSERPKLYTILAFLSAVGLRQVWLFMRKKSYKKCMNCVLCSSLIEIVLNCIKSSLRCIH